MLHETTTFFFLPGELRNDIYNLVLVHSKPISIDAIGLKPRILDLLASLKILALTLANRQTYEEHNRSSTVSIRSGL
jgi:hypothetical protein